ncbi:MAG: hypothetical protein WEE50_02185 [Chloroflexota bacterium]
MKAPIRAVLLASALTLAVAAPVSADPPTTTHVSNSDCFTVDGFTYCSQTETDIRTKEQKSGATKLKMDVSFLTTTVDAEGNLVASVESTSKEHGTVVVENGGPIFIDQNVWREDEVTEGGVTTCTRYRLLIKHEIERINNVKTTSGPC